MTSFFHPTLYALFPQEGIITQKAHGIDISKYDLVFHPDTATAQLDFVVQRISYGITRDEAYFSLVPGVKQVDIRLGYHYLSSWYDYRTQADTFLRYIEGTEYHAFVCDFEGAFNNLSTAFAKTAWDWMNYVQDKTGKEVIVYTGKYLYQDYLIPSQPKYNINWNSKKLWIAQYLFVPNPDGQPSLPAGRVGWTMWQYTDKGDGTKYGAGRTSACDLNVYNGTLPEMKSWLNIGETTPEPPPTGELMDKYMKVTDAVTQSLNIRTSGENLGTQNDLGTFNLLKADIIHVIASNPNNYQRFDKLYRNNVLTQLPTSPTGEYWSLSKDSSGTYLVDTTFTPPTQPPVSNVPEYITAHFTDGTTKKYLPE